ncbi:MAG TPA: hypothetical protein VMY77_19090 [Chitinophagaceae bacterium]|nr:hypothetical protein [Chitinophagaceae bacterium]
MLKFTCILLSFISVQSVTAQRKVSSYFSLQYNKTIYDITSGNNPSGVGLGLEAYFNTKSKFKPVIDITAHVYLEDDKVLRMDGYGREILDVGAMINVFAGVLFQPTERTFLSLLAGPSFINGASFGIKPSIGFYFDKRQKIMAKMSFINIFNRNTDTEFKSDFGSMSFAIGFKLF